MTKKILITGAASGLGKALAFRYAKANTSLCLADINEEEGKEVVAQINAQGGNAFFSPCNITNQQSINTLTEELTQRWGKLDVLINNAGVATAGALSYEDIEQWKWVFDINVFGIVRMTRALYPLLQQAAKNAPAKVINIASQAGITPIPIMGSYNASKAAVVSFSETMHLELAADNIEVHVACPSFFNTNLDNSLRTTQPGIDKVLKKLLSRSDLTADDVANIIYQQSLANQFMIVTHKAGRLALAMKRFLPTKRYLNMIKNKTKHFGRISDKS